MTWAATLSVVFCFAQQEADKKEVDVRYWKCSSTVGSATEAVLRRSKTDFRAPK